VDFLARKVDLAAKKVDFPPWKVDLEAWKVDFLPWKVDLAARKVEFLPWKVGLRTDKGANTRWQSNDDRKKCQIFYRENMENVKVFFKQIIKAATVRTYPLHLSPGLNT
jgi:hypothetical protein